MPTGAVIADRWFIDNAGSYPMAESDTLGKLLYQYPLPANAVTNPDYVPTATCFVGTDPSIPICYDPIHSGWSIDASAVDSAGRVLTYSMVITHFSENTLLDDMRANLHINTATGKITQVCPASCHDANGPGEYLVTVIELPLGGSLPLVRKFKIKAMDFG